MSDKKRERLRRNSKIERLPEEVKAKIDDLLEDTSITYLDISDELKQMGFDISKAAVGRYALHVNKAAMRVSESIKKTEAISKVIKDNPDIDFTRGSRVIMMEKLLDRVSTADEEFDDLSIEKAGRLIAEISRAETQATKSDRDYKKKIELAFNEFEAQLLALVKSNPDLSIQMRNLLSQIKDVVTNEH